jgi:anthranilate phosphoribosyltransferase
MRRECHIISLFVPPLPMIRIAPYLKEIGRGKHGARSLTETQAHTVFSAVLDQQISDLELGAFLMAMRIKAEAVQELIGFAQAAQERCIALPAPAAPAVVLPSYNGSRRLPNLTALLAGLLAQRGLAVWVHGPTRDPNRVGTAEVFEALGWANTPSAEQVQTAWSQRQPVFLPIEVLCPPLARLLALRWTMGVRSSGHSVAKLMNPSPHQAVLRVVNYTHPEYVDTLSAMLQQARAHALLLRGTEGEPVADPRRQPRMDVYLHGQLQADLSLPLQEGSLAELPQLASSNDAASTAQFTQAVLQGDLPVPAPLQTQVNLLHRAWERMQNSAHLPA